MSAFHQISTFSLPRSTIFLLLSFFVSELAWNYTESTVNNHQTGSWCCGFVDAADLLTIKVYVPHSRRDCRRNFSRSGKLRCEWNEKRSECFIEEISKIALNSFELRQFRIPRGMRKCFLWFLSEKAFSSFEEGPDRQWRQGSQQMFEEAIWFIVEQLNCTLVWNLQGFVIRLYEFAGRNWIRWKPTEMGWVRKFCHNKLWAFCNYLKLSTLCSSFS